MTHYWNTPDRPGCSIRYVPHAPGCSRIPQRWNKCVSPRAYSQRSTNSPQHVEAKHVVICQPCNRKYKSQSAIDQHWRSSTAHPNCPVCGAGAADTPALAEVSFDRLARPICLEHPLILGVTSTSRMPIRKYAVAACCCTRAIWTHTILRRATTPRAGRVASALQPSWNMPRYAGHATPAPRKLMLTSGLRL